MDLAHAISIVVARPLVLAVIDRGVWQVHSVVTAVLIRIHHRRVVWDRLSENALTRDLVAVPDNPAAFFARLAADDMNDRRSIIVVRAVPPLFVRAPTRRIVHVAMWRTFFPQRSGRAHPPRTFDHSSYRLARCRSHWFGSVAAAYGRSGARDR